jgi:hypothetical protein
MFAHAIASTIETTPISSERNVAAIPRSSGGTADAVLRRKPNPRISCMPGIGGGGGGAVSSVRPMVSASAAAWLNDTPARSLPPSAMFRLPVALSTVVIAFGIQTSATTTLVPLKRSAATPMTVIGCPLICSVRPRSPDPN